MPASMVNGLTAAYKLIMWKCENVEMNFHILTFPH
jgi:hypothetical protein